MSNSINSVEANTNTQNPDYEALGLKDAALAAASLGSLSVAEFLHDGSTEQYITGGVGTLCGAYVIYRALRYFK